MKDKTGESDQVLRGDRRWVWNWLIPQGLCAIRNSSCQVNGSEIGCMLLHWC